MILPPHEIKMLEGKQLTQETITYFKKRYDKRFVRALRAVDEGKVLKYQFFPSETITWVVKGRRRKYLLIPRIYCTCRSFYQDVVISQEAEFCYHLLAQLIAELRNKQQNVQSTDTERRKLYTTLRRTD